mmetsp:Transcript_41601/g.97098  ORF Transcript_41601/g.97098 Transcript_41601/m.97098 type:complete len:170 (+) Transcript_41601:473-982(+)
MLASKDLTPGKHIVQIPSHLVLSLETARERSEAIKAVFNTYSQQCGIPILPQKALFVLFLLHEAVNEASFWRPYLCTLPRVVDLPLAWPRVLMWKHWDAVHEWLVRPNPDLFPTKLFTPVAWEWAWSMAQTRTWGGNPPEWLLNLVSDAGKVRCGGGRARARASEGDVC